MSNCTQLSSLVLSVHGLPNVSNVGNDPVILNSSDGEIVHLFTADLNSRIVSSYYHCCTISETVSAGIDCYLYLRYLTTYFQAMTGLYT